MAQASTLKSVSITNLDTIPPRETTTGSGAPGHLRNVSDSVAPLSADTTASTYRVCRVPTQAKIKGVRLWSTVASAGAADFNIAFSDSTVDGTPASVQGTIPQISAANNKLFGAAQSLVAQAGVSLLFANATNFPYATAMNQPLWQVLGFTQDPGGFFDFLLNVTTAVTTGGALVLSVDYVV